MRFFRPVFVVRAAASLQAPNTMKQKRREITDSSSKLACVLCCMVFRKPPLPAFHFEERGCFSRALFAPNFVAVCELASRAGDEKGQPDFGIH